MEGLMKSSIPKRMGKIAHSIKQNMLKELEQIMNEEEQPDGVYSLSLDSIEQGLGHCIAQADLMEATGDMMQWIDEISFEDGSYLQCRLFLSFRYSEEDRSVAIRINPELRDIRASIGKIK